MRITVDSVLKLPRSLQNIELAKLDAIEAISFASELVSLAKSKGYALGFFTTESVLKSKLPLSNLLPQIKKLLKQFPEVPEKELAIDRQFDEKKERLEAIISDLNENRIPSARYYELLYENYFDELADDNLPDAKTFAAYAFLRLKERWFLGTLKDMLGDIQFAHYMQTLNYLPYVQESKSLNIFDLYLKDHGAYGVDGELTQRHKDILRHLMPSRQVIDVVHDFNNVNTHNESSHKTADESHVLAFRMMLDATRLQVAANYEKPSFESRAIVCKLIDDLMILAAKLKICPGKFHINLEYREGLEKHHLQIESLEELNEFIRKYKGNDACGNLEAKCEVPELSRVITVTRNESLNNFVSQKIIELQKEIALLVAMDNQAIYDNYLRYSIAGKNVGKTHIYPAYVELTKPEQASAQIRIDGLRFKANTALRYINSMISEHKCSGSYPYSTNDVNGCGLTMEEMVATAYWASKDKANFKPNATEQVNFIYLITQLHDMRRGYNIDQKIDIPDEDIYPQNPEIDYNRCAGGGINSLANLPAFHYAYNPLKIERIDIEVALRKIYDKIIDSNRDLVNTAHQEELEYWRASGNITGELRGKLKKIFEEKHQQEFEGFNKGYVPDNIFAIVINQGLDNIHFPDWIEIKIKGIEDWDIDKIYAAIKNDTLPLLHLDRKKGYQSTLNYLSELENNNNLIKNLFDLAAKEDLKEPSVQKAIWFLSKSNLADEYKKVEILKVGNISITLGDLIRLSLKELDILCTKPRGELLETIIEKDKSSLFELYATKFGFTFKELTTGYGYRRYTPLHYAIYNGLIEVFKAVFANAKIDKLALILKFDSEGNTLLHKAVSDGSVECVTTIIKSVDSVTMSTLMDLTNTSIKNGNGTYGGLTPLQEAIRLLQFRQPYYIIPIIKALFNSVDNKAKLKFKDLRCNDVNKSTILQSAAKAANVEVIKAIREAVGAEIMLAYIMEKDAGGYNTLHEIASTGTAELFNAVLNSVDLKMRLPLLAEKTNDGQNILEVAAYHNTEVRSTERAKLAKAILDVAAVDKALTASLITAQNQKYNYTPLHQAANNCNTEFVRAIFNAVAEDIPTKQRLLTIKSRIRGAGTAFEVAIERGDNNDVVELFLENGALPTLEMLSWCQVKPEIYLRMLKLHFGSSVGAEKDLEILMQGAIRCQDYRCVIDPLVEFGAIVTFEMLLSLNVAPEAKSKMLNSFLASSDNTKEHLLQLMQCATASNDTETLTQIHRFLASAHTERNPQKVQQLLVYLYSGRDEVAVSSLLDNGAVPTLGMLLFNSFSREINSGMQGIYLKSIANSVITTAVSAVEIAADIANPRLNRALNEELKRHAEEQGGEAKRQKFTHPQYL